VDGRQHTPVKPEDLDGWIPARISWRSGEPFVEWRWLGERRLTEPFFGDTLNRALQNPFTLLFRQETPIGILRTRAEIRPGLRPAGLIFHMSRCGSTLVSQVLSASPENVVISESPALDSLLRGGTQVVTEQRIAWIPWIVGALAQQRTGQETRCFIKLDCWHTPYLPLLRKVFPDVPWIFVYRDPVEVLASHEGVPALWRVPGMLDPELIGTDLASVRLMDPLEYCARVLGEICERALSFRTDRLGRLVNYSELPEALWTTIGSHFGMALPAADIAIMRQTAQFNAKVPQVHFESDSQAKRSRASVHAAALAERWLSPAYQRLEQARKEQSYGAVCGAAAGS
jgi:hypothetical protein